MNTFAVKIRFSLLLLAVIGIYADSCIDETRPDGKGVYLSPLMEYKHCKYLTQYYPEDKYIGIYSHREFYCFNTSLADCCTSCALVLKNKKCLAGEIRDDKGVYVDGADTYFDCKYLRTYLADDKYVGIYQNRDSYCEDRRTDCCSTCATLRAEFECQKGNVADGEGVFVPRANRYFDCKYLLQEYPEDKLVGIYSNRDAYCRDERTDCCTSCAKLSGELPKSTLKPETQSTQKQTAVSNKRKVQDECTNNCLWIGDGSYGRCDWLIDQVNHKDIFNRRFSLCADGFALGCKGTCAEILKNTPQTGVITYGPSGGDQTDGKIVVVPLVNTNTKSSKLTSKPTMKQSATYRSSVNSSTKTPSQGYTQGQNERLLDLLRQNFVTIQAEEEKQHRQFAYVLTNIFNIFKQSLRQSLSVNVVNLGDK